MVNIPVTVLMPVYNGERYLREAIDSVLAQTFADFEFLIINDGSTDGTKEILESYTDSRIRLVYTANSGIAVSLKKGVELAVGNYIARMDADDICLPDRLATQKKCLDDNPDAVMTYCMVDYIDQNGKIVLGGMINGYESVLTKWHLIWHNLPSHPTVMMRSVSLKKNNINYRPEMNRSEDFDLWNRLAPVGDFLFVPEVLLRYRRHEKSISNTNPTGKQINTFAKVISENFQRCGYPVDEETSYELAVISGGAGVNPLMYKYKYLFWKLDELLEKISACFAKKHSIDERKLHHTQADQLMIWARHLLHCSKPYSAYLLLQSVKRDKKSCLTKYFWSICGAMFLPSMVISWINAKRSF